MDQLGVSFGYGSAKNCLIEFLAERHMPVIFTCQLNISSEHFNFFLAFTMC